ncbi:UmoC family protein [Proteus hauseri ATCC 700826]|uniref:UmoC family protein n=1 Tax=Proteus hauseri ATCC 700826 TaxID=1354271 RepID=A0AAJ3LTD9_PROHU|nr:lysozyme inhibitor LprI family protein [Proteus hauseri]OAT45558.1 UmoC family protein [Proteus hauseri ATCC 700826]
MKVSAFIISCSLFMVSFLSFSSIAQVASDPLTKCYELTSQAPRTEIQTCLLDELKLSERQMNLIYEKSKSDLEDIDSVAVKSAIEALVSSQEHFIKFRSAECQRQSSLVMGGTGAGDVLLACEVKLNQWRAKVLLEN